MKIYNIIVTHWLFFLLIATSLPAQERILVEKTVNQEQHIYRDFSLSADHIVLTVTPKEIGVLNIEIFFLSDSTFPVSLEVLECPNGAKCTLSDSVVKSTKIVQLTVEIITAKDVLKQDSLMVKASGGGKEKFLKVLMFMANPLPLNYAISLGVSPGQPLEYGTIQPIEGRVVPYLPGNIILKIIHPDSQEVIISLPIDTLGYFVHNHVFRYSGPWSAQATFKSTKGKTLAVSDTINFPITKRKPRIAVTTIEPWKKNIGDTLNIVGQIIADEEDIVKLCADLSIHAPSMDTSVQVPLGNDGRFSYKYLVADSGSHRIIATPIEVSFSSLYSPRLSTLYALSSNYIRETDAEDNSSPPSSPPPPTGKAEFNIGEFEHAIILEGGGTCSSNQNYIANNIKDILEQRQIQNILHFRCTDDNSDNDNGNDDDGDKSICDCKEELQDFLEDIIGESGNGACDDSLIIIVIGQGVYNPSGTNKINFCGEDIVADDLLELFDLDDIGNYLSNFAQVIWLAACDYSGDFLYDPVISNEYHLNILITSTESDESDYLCDYDLSNDFLGQFFNYIDCDCGVKEAFYESRESFTSIHPMLDDNGSTDSPDGTFIHIENCEGNGSNCDGLNSGNVFIGLNSGDDKNQPEDDKTTASISGAPLLSNQARIIVALDNPNNFPITGFTAKVIPPQGSDMSEVQVPLVYDSLSTAYKSKLICFSDSGSYRISTNYSYLDGEQRQRFRTSTFEKVRHVVPKPVIIENGDSTCLNFTATPLLGYFHFDYKLLLKDSPSYRLRLAASICSRLELEVEAGYTPATEEFRDLTHVRKNGFIFDIGGSIALYPITIWKFDPYFSVGGGWLTLRNLTLPHSDKFIYYGGGFIIHFSDLWGITAEAKGHVIYNYFGLDKTTNLLINVGVPFSLYKIWWKR